ncbi:hypothetical protein KC19_2G106300 [Ceratodon purpureus]|uniref:Uncharacterized protein n=1 Tax=Ceratodon purpureus TaxID=3225 RepID=A0A8T0IU28_CERPU|nr:hypothetical protein KC19_2G106300 [Ceratodon purpureus]KAG0586648.1 hypothetical protein KC19_2G106300 [Ceratodon purpureus]KAG0586649.1 hypothetical protein KC19_2G106300 [Ceratodon purpureus]
MATSTCHSRWCPRYLPSFADNETRLPAAELCKDVSWTLRYYFNSTVDQLRISNNQWLPAACKLWCGEPSNQLLQLEAAGLSKRLAVLIWFMVILMIVCVIVQLLSICMERGTRKVAMVGGPMYLAFMALMVWFSVLNSPFYPIVGAMNVAAFSYYFSSFQYSIAVTHELASATALLFTMFPVWTVLTADTGKFHSLRIGYKVNWVFVREMDWLVLAMLVLSIFWIIHSSLFRTIGYRAFWIAAFNKQLTEGRRTHGKDFMSSLWILSGAQGHPTWRTPTGQSFGLYLTVLSWIVALRIHNYIRREYCRDDLILFHISLWISPSILTWAVLATQAFMCRNTSCEFQGNCNSFPWTWFMADFKSLWNTFPHMEEAIISYRLGRDTLEVESSEKVKKYKILLCGGRVEQGMAILLWGIEAVLLAIAYPGILVCKLYQGLGTCILRCTSNFAWFKRRQSISGFKLSERIKAYQIVREHCFDDTVNRSGKMSDVYERSRMKNHNGLEEPEIDEDFCNVLRNHRKDIKLPLVLDSLGPSCFSYVLERLVEVLNEHEPLEEVENGENESEEDIDQFLLYWTT